MVISGRSVNLTKLILGRLHPPVNDNCSKMLFEVAEGETKVMSRTGYQIRDFLFWSQARYRRLGHAAPAVIESVYCAALDILSSIHECSVLHLETSHYHSGISNCKYAIIKLKIHMMQAE